MSKNLENFWAVSNRVLLVRIHAKPFNLPVIQVYAPTSESSEGLDAFYSDLDNALKTYKSQKIVIMMGDLNAKLAQKKYRTCYYGGDCGSNHSSVVCKIRIKLKKIMSEVAPKRLNFVSLSQNDEIKVKYNVEKCPHSIIKYISVNEQRRGHKWKTDDIVSLMDKRRKVKGCSPNSYKKLDKTIKKMCFEAKKKWLNDKCEIIENQKQ
ncbi:hypothetical protein HELRODRAFT_166921 [Helobdella robusta]|uniref:Endonuclease/exonuclease/phosphatase domain-containing protein n=1 Tax=Helobdella robusta TaxID=6412 RepID=T1EYR4_HELRO|nr:hypothetical protein HELRODRAFT_166921 [Helobdella robusta]ESO11850.1 hypothetical protein HELRODRAFT_166921 [Helobdella robusta]